MKNLKYIEKPVEERIVLPTVEKIKEDGISPELRAQLLNPKTEFNGDLVVFPLNEEDKSTAKKNWDSGSNGNNVRCCRKRRSSG